MDKTYNPKDFEDRIYNDWMKDGCFTADAKSDKPPYTIVIPPPNITGQLHMGHALNNTLQDVITRYKRMSGYNALWVPGTDHASIATEVKIIEKLAEEGLSKRDLGREGFLKRAWEWKEQYGGRIIEQLKKMGFSCDWSRLCFTFDEERGKAVEEVFVKWYKEGYIYQGDRIINWCPNCKTALSDAEVEHIQTDGNLWHIKYFVEGSDSEFIVVATTRPETMLGDTAVAVNPNDKRYKNLVGKILVLPLVNRRIPVIADNYVDSKFGTGAVKITPAHDPNDMEVGLRHNLEVIRVMDDGGFINEKGGVYSGLDRFKARDKVVEDLKKSGNLVKIEKHISNKGHCYRCDDTVEPIVSKQWFVKMSELVKPAIADVKTGKIKITPKRFEKVYFNWLYNIRDWCISRQLWWGHRIPAYYCADCGKTTVEKGLVTKCSHCGSSKITQDEDVLDTWFSSGLWPFSTLGYPDKTLDLKTFFPTNTLITASDIIFFWVARMVIFSEYFMGQPPFKDVVFNGIVRDKFGKKMSKSSGNGVDPLELIDLYGADALRFSLLFGNSCGSDIRFSADKIADDRAFIAKIWNASRFVIMNAEDVEILPIEKIKLNDEDKWIYHKFNIAAKKVNKLFDKFEIGLAATVCYEFVWNDFCDWYIELVKPALIDEAKKQRAVSILTDILGGILRLLHPIIPFVTEEIYSHLKTITKEQGYLMCSEYPMSENKSVADTVKSNIYGIKGRFKKSFEDINEVIALIKAIRETRTAYNVPQSKRTRLYIKPLKKEAVIKKSLSFICKLGMGSDIAVVETAPEEKTTAVVTNLAEVYIPLGQLVDNEQEKARLKKELETAVAELERAKAKLNNTGFTSKAPIKLIEEEKLKIAKYEELERNLRSKLKETD